MTDTYSPTPSPATTSAPAVSASGDPRSQAFRLEQISVSDFDNNCYLLIDDSTTLDDGKHPGLLIDAADDAPALLAFAKDCGATITTLVTTHQHWDHVRATEDILEITGATHIVPEPDAAGIPGRHDAVLSDGDSIVFGGVELPVRVVSGHTPGGFILAAPIRTTNSPTAPGATQLFVGDNLFPGGVGKTDSAEDFAQLLGDVTAAVFDVYGDDVVVHPGHGKSTTVGAERPHLEQWAERGW